MFIGVDGGGTKTEMVVLDSEGVIKATHRTGGSSYLALGLEALGTLLAQGIETLLGKAGLRAADVEFAFFGLPAFGTVRTIDAQPPGLRHVTKSLRMAGLANDDFAADNGFFSGK